jgi:uncharacterized membrane protein YtjA (UPF0391 family)
MAPKLPFDWSSFNKQQKVLVGAIIATCFGVVLMLVSMITPYWVHVVIPGGQWRNESSAYVIGHHSGLWRICRTELHNQTQPEFKRTLCTRLKLFPSKDEIITDPEIDPHILDYSRSETAFAVIALLLMVLGIVFSIYAVREPRYMFKRLAGMLHIMTAICILVCSEVLLSSVAYERENLPKRLPPGSYIHYGASFGLAWIVFVIFLAAALINFYYGRKRKRDDALDEKEAMENEPVHLGRM